MFYTQFPQLTKHFGEKHQVIRFRDFVIFHCLFIFALCCALKALWTAVVDTFWKLGNGNLCSCQITVYICKIAILKIKLQMTINLWTPIHAACWWGAIFRIQLCHVAIVINRLCATYHLFHSSLNILIDNEQVEKMDINYSSNGVRH